MNNNEIETAKQSAINKYNRFMKQIKPTYIFMKRYHIPTIKYIKMQINSAKTVLNDSLSYYDNLN